MKGVGCGGVVAYRLGHHALDRQRVETFQDPRSLCERGWGGGGGCNWVGAELKHLHWGLDRVGLG